MGRNRAARLIERLACLGAVTLGVSRCGGEPATSAPDASTSDSSGVVDGGTAYHEMTPSFFSSFSTATVNAKARGFAGAVFDGRYLYLVPSFNGSFDGLVARYDTTASFSDGASWSTFDTTTVNANAKGYTGAAFDGRYVYLVPYEPTSAVARYDTQASFTDGASWSTFDMTT